MRTELLALGLLACTADGVLLPTTGTGFPDPQVTPQDLGPMDVFGLAIEPPGATFDGETEVAVTSPDPEAEIWYTVDGSLPVPGESLQYTGPFTVSESTQVRATAAPFGGARSDASAVFLALEAPSWFRSDLPLMVLWSHGDAPQSRSETYESYTLTLFGPDLGGEVSWPGPADLSARAGIRVRGSSSAGYPKRPYRVETWGPIDGDDEDIAPLGLPPDADWVLVAPLDFDRALVRNALTYHLSNSIGRYAPRTRFVELFVAERSEALGADDYQGVYVLVERVEGSSERVGLTELEPWELTEPAISGGYLFKEDRIVDDEVGFEAGLAGGLFEFQQPFVMVEPNGAQAPPEQADWLADRLDELGEALAAPDFRHPVTGRHYEDLIDVDSWIDHHILNVLVKNPDAFRLSGYFHKERGDTIHAGPLWDFDRTMGCSTDARAADPTWWDNRNETDDTTDVFEHGFWRGLFRDPVFRARYFARWTELLDNELALPRILAAVADLQAEVAEAAPRNYAAWPDYPPRGGDLDSEIGLLESWITTRHGWIRSCLALPDPRTCTGD